MKRILFTISTLFLGLTQVQSQTVDASPETQTICGGGTANLTAVITPGAGTPGTNSYTISTIPYAPDPLSAGTAVSLTDDSQTGFLPIGFSFCYFGNSYTQFIIGSNNWIGFQAGETSTWVTAAIPNTSGAIAPRNTIMGPWQDINPGVGGTVKYATYGTAPFRRLSVSWDNVPMFSCTGQLYSSQIIIYETTNIIETHILNKSLCPSWNSGNAVHGLHNSTGTIAFTVPGRNNTAWTASNEGTRFTPNGTSLYQVNWYILPANTLVGTGLSITVTPPTSPQYYYAQVVDLNSCSGSGGTPGSNTDTVVVLSQTPSVDAGPYTQICPGTPANLSATAPTATSFSWSPAGSLSNPSISNPVATPSSTTTYTLTVTDALGCNNSDTVTVALATPAPTATASAPFICEGSSSNLTATGGGTYSWSPGTGLSSTTIANPVATPTVDITYTVTVAGSGGCTATSTVSITVIPAPPVDAGTSAAICTGSSTTLSASGANSYVWSPGTGLSSTTVSNPTANPSSTTTYTVVGTDLNGCTASDNVTVTVNPIPVVDAGTNTTICPSATTTLNATGATSYTWSPGTGLSSTTIANPNASPASTTTYTVTGSSAGCTATDVVTISVNPINVFTTGATTICSGGSTTINAFGATNYLWSPSGTLSNATVSSPVATPTSTTTYTVVGTNGAGCNDTAFVTVTVTPPPATDAGSAVSICAGSSTVLNGSGATSYSWSPGTGLSSTTVANPTASPASTTTYTVTGTQGGCTSTDVVTVTVNPVPAVDAGTSASICSGGSTVLNGSGGTTFSWSPAGSLTGATTATPTATPSATTTYTLTGTSAGCSATDTVTIFVGGLVVTASATSPTICAGTSTTLNASGGTTFSWSPGTGLSSTTISNPVATPASTTSYTVTGTSGTCTNTAVVTVTVTPLPAVSAGSSVSICSGSSTTLSGTGATSYSWSPGTGLSSTTVASPTASPAGTTTYTVTGTSSGCSATSTVTVTVNPAPTAFASASPAMICAGSSTSLGATGGTSYSWSPGTGLSSTTVANPTATPSATTTYTVVVTSSGCTASAAVTVTVNPMPLANAGSDVSVCTGGSTTLSASGGTTYSWSPASGLSSTTVSNPTATPSATTTYTVSVSNGSCTSTDVVVVTVNSSMSMAAATSTPTNCGDIPGSGTLTAGTISGGGSPYMYSVNGGTPQSSSTFSGLTAGTYTVVVSDAGGCTASSTVTVGSVNNVNASFSASPSSGTAPLTVVLTNSSTGATDYIWDFDNGFTSLMTNPSTVYPANGTYVITLIAYNNIPACADTATTTINVFDEGMMTVPNIFTPNGDGHNDMFKVISSGIKSVEGTMYNRWGKKIAEWGGDPSTAGWDGKVNGKTADDGTYFYEIKAVGADNKEYEAHGYVQLLNK